ncbi:tail fiber domain-containing protein [Marinoscillum sp.]|uniref:tail fiber domain-containing protein n=1 Tax=Marinoscillum sp. TaxID=2024838 RepID=UPI003BA9C4FB
MKTISTTFLLLLSGIVFAQLKYSGSSLGIGTSSPSSRLNVHGSSANLEISNPTESESGILFYDHGYESSQYAKILFDCAGSNALNFYFKSTTPSLSLSGSTVTVKNHSFSTTALTLSGNLYTSVGNAQLGSNSTPWYQGRIRYLYRDYEYSLSDKSVKKEIKPIEHGIGIINKLNPVSYFMRDTSNTKKQYGFIAQEVNEVLPELTSYDEEMDLMYLNYEGIIPILVHALQMQQKHIDKLDSIIAFRGPKNEKNTEDVSELNSPTSRLGQNHPNPFNKSTKIDLYIKQKAISAYLYIFDFNGILKRSFTITNRGNSSVLIEANQFSPGIYHYSLVVDGKEVDTKKMILTN